MGEEDEDRKPQKSTDKRSNKVRRAPKTQDREIQKKLYCRTNRHGQCNHGGVLVDVNNVS